MRPPKVLAPAGRGMFRYVYLIGLTDGTIKVGQSYHVRQRLRKHRADHQHGFAWSHVFAGYGAADGRKIEARAIRAMEQAGQRRGRTEMFTGIERAQAIALIRAEIGAVQPAA